MCLLKILMFSSIHLRDGEEYKTLISFCDYSVLCRQRQAEGIVCAKARGVYKGRRKTIDEDCMRASLVSQPSLILQFAGQSIPVGGPLSGGYSCGQTKFHGLM